MSEHNSHCTGNLNSAIQSIKKGFTPGQQGCVSLFAKNVAVISQMVGGLAFLTKTKGQSMFERTPFICLYVKQDFKYATTNECPKLKNVSEL